ncbi:phage tail protein [Janthinobacterium sp. SUN098]|uniref:phage tail protein n=1 Tax=Janthinobacterium sp. SUN098 TaxID=3002437 RepID=UPI0038D3B0F8
MMTNEKTRKHGIAFKFEFNNRETVDISIKLNLTEHIAVKPARPVGRAAAIKASEDELASTISLFKQPHGGVKAGGAIRIQKK